MNLSDKKEQLFIHTCVFFCTGKIAKESRIVATVLSFIIKDWIFSVYRDTTNDKTAQENIYRIIFSYAEVGHLLYVTIPPT